MNKRFVIITLFFLILIFQLYGCDNDTTAKVRCCEIVSFLRTSAYNDYGNYSKLSEDYKKTVSSTCYSEMNYRTDDNSDYGKLDKDYYETNEFSKPNAEIRNDEIIVKYTYTYECHSLNNDELLRGSYKIPIVITLKQNGNDYVITDYYEQP